MNKADGRRSFFTKGRIVAKSIDPEKQRIIEERIKIAEIRTQERLKREKEEEDRKGKGFANRIIVGLMVRIRQEARRNSNSLEICLPKNKRTHDKAEEVISNWCGAYGLKVERKNIQHPTRGERVALIVSGWIGK